MSLHYVLNKLGQKDQGWKVSTCGTRHCTCWDEERASRVLERAEKASTSTVTLSVVRRRKAWWMVPSTACRRKDWVG